LLEIQGVSAAHGAVEVLRDVSLRVEQGAITCLLGPNGAGKTTLLQAITGLLPVKRGAITFEGKPLSGLRADRIVAMGVAMVPENRLVFPQMTVHENLLAGGYLRLRRARREVAADLERMLERFPVLRERRTQLAGTLSGGEQQMLAIARALMARPRLLLMDEPSLGLAPLVVEEIFRHISELHREGTTTFVVEQNARVALACAQRAFVLEQGRVTFAGSPGELAGNEVIRRAYLGSSAVPPAAS
jgi:branched-chain amino acid transport system ATP-binding protein